MQYMTKTITESEYDIDKAVNEFLTANSHLQIADTMQSSTTIRDERDIDRIFVTITFLYLIN